MLFPLLHLERGMLRYARSMLGALVLAGCWSAAPAAEREVAAATVFDVAMQGALKVDDRAALLAEIHAVGRRGFLYAVTRPTDDDAPSRPTLFLYGTIHLGASGSEPFNGPLLDALSRSRRVAVEADPSDESRTQRLALALGRYDGDDRLSRHVSSEVMSRIATFGQRHHLAVDDLGRFKPWLLANMIVLTGVSGVGLDPAMGSEMYLTGFARGTGLPIVEIEGIEAQLRLLADVPEPVQAAQLDEALAEDDGEGQAQTWQLFSLWQAGDAASGDALIASMRRDAVGKVFERYYFDTLIDARNLRMADRAERFLDEPGDTFFAVGTLHLFGDTGLVHEFERRGYRVTDLQAER